jgi:hypothetical protein
MLLESGPDGARRSSAKGMTSAAITRCSSVVLPIPLITDSSKDATAVAIRLALPEAGAEVLAGYLRKEQREPPLRVL